MTHFIFKLLISSFPNQSYVNPLLKYCNFEIENSLLKHTWRSWQVTFKYPLYRSGLKGLIILFHQWFSLWIYIVTQLCASPAEVSNSFKQLSQVFKLHHLCTCSRNTHTKPFILHHTSQTFLRHLKITIRKRREVIRLSTWQIWVTVSPCLAPVQYVSVWRWSERLPLSSLSLHSPHHNTRPTHIFTALQSSLASAWAPIPLTLNHAVMGQRSSLSYFLKSTVTDTKLDWQPDPSL